MTQAQAHKRLSRLSLISWSHWPHDASISWQGLVREGKILWEASPAAQLADGKATMLQPKSTMANQRDTLSAAGGVIVLLQERSHQRTCKDSCFSNRKKVNYFTDEPPWVFFSKLLLVKKMVWLAEVTLLWKISFAVRTGSSLRWHPVK